MNLYHFYEPDDVIQIVERDLEISWSLQMLRAYFDISGAPGFMYVNNELFLISWIFNYIRIGDQAEIIIHSKNYSIPYLFQFCLHVDVRYLGN